MVSGKTLKEIRKELDHVIEEVEKLGAEIIKPAQKVFGAFIPVILRILMGT